MSDASYALINNDVPASQVQVTISCKNLANKDTLSKSDPMCVVYTKNVETGKYIEFGRTEMIKDTLNPDFVKPIEMLYFFEKSQHLRFEMYDVDSPNGSLQKQDFLGFMECTMGQIIANCGKFELGLIHPKITRPGSITVRAEELGGCKEHFSFRFDGVKLDKKDFFGKSDPFLIIRRLSADGSFVSLHKTEVIKNTLNPVWKPFTISGRNLCAGDYEKQLRFDCYDWDSDGGHDFIGQFFTTVTELKKRIDQEVSYELINPKKKAKKKSYTNSGVIRLLSLESEIKHTFVDFIQSGTQMNFTVAVDFTQSNGNPKNSDSLHYYTREKHSPYGVALQAVGDIIKDYDSDKMFPALGFGGKLPDGTVSHEFFLSGNPTNPYCSGIEGILAAYYQSLTTVNLFGPTNFAPVINHVAKFASAYPNGSNYFVLLILTDGIITDMNETKTAVVQASQLPMSIIIVGIGVANFSAMEQLDADKVPLRCPRTQQVALRDIVQFVALNDYTNNGRTEPCKAELARSVLAEIPSQVELFMKMNNISPPNNPHNTHISQ